MPNFSERLPDALRPLPISGTYLASGTPADQVAARIEPYEVVRIDVDGTYPQFMASGSYKRSRLSIAAPTHWVAHEMKEVGFRGGTWEGPILQVWGDAIPHKKVRISVPQNQTYAHKRRMTITFYNGAPTVSRTLYFYSPYFREVVFEFDTVEDSSILSVLNTCAHPYHPTTLVCETLTFDKVYERAGVEVTRYPRRSTVPLSLAGGNSTWSDAELNDAMKNYWSSYSDTPSWAVWGLFAGRGDPIITPGEPVQHFLGIMFDHSGANQRQGVAIFNDQIEDFVPDTEPNRDEQVARLRFYDLLHETGHCFNLHHAWLGYPYSWKWPDIDTAEGTATIMNYPAEDKCPDFFGGFEYTFHRSDLKFLRHGPENLVEMGDEPFPERPDLTDGGLVSPWKLDVTVHRSRGVFEFLEPVTLNIKLTNAGKHPRIVDGGILHDGGNFALVIARTGGRARLWRPFAHHCVLPSPHVLEAGQSLSASLFISAGLDGWYLAEPGPYKLQAMLRVSQSTIFAQPLNLRIAQSCRWDQELVAQDFFTHDVGRALAFGGTRTMTSALATLQETVDRLPDCAVSLHAALALAQPLMRDYRVLRTSPADEDRGFSLKPANHEVARWFLHRALLETPEHASDTLGRIAHHNHVEGFAAWLENNGAGAEAAKVRGHILKQPSA